MIGDETKNQKSKLKMQNDKSKFKIMNSNAQKGFTVFELVVTIFVFSFIAVIASGAFVETLKLQRRATNTQFTEEGARFILESMAREIRVANVINNPDNGCLSSPPALSLTIEHPINGIVTYAFSGNIIERTVSGETASITPENISVTRFNFYCSGTVADDDRQPRVTILASFESGIGSDKATIDIQTTASQRRLSN